MSKSALRRAGLITQIKCHDRLDSGKWIPGIGGAFDLADSLVLSAPVAYLILRTIV